MSVLLNRGSGGKRSRHSRRMRNPQSYVSGKRAMGAQAGVVIVATDVVNRGAMYTTYHEYREMVVQDMYRDTKKVIQIRIVTIYYTLLCLNIW